MSFRIWIWYKYYSCYSWLFIIKFMNRGIKPRNTCNEYCLLNLFRFAIQGRSHTFESGRAQAPKIILVSFYFKKWRGLNMLTVGGQTLLALSKTTPLLLGIRQFCENFESLNIDRGIQNHWLAFLTAKCIDGGCDVTDSKLRFPLVWSYHTNQRQ